MSIWLSLVNFLILFQTENKDKDNLVIRENTSINFWLLSEIHRNLLKCVERCRKKIEWTSLLGGEKCTLLKKLPDFFEEILLLGRASTVKKLWIV